MLPSSVSLAFGMAKKTREGQQAGLAADVIGQQLYNTTFVSYWPDLHVPGLTDMWARSESGNQQILHLFDESFAWSTLPAYQSSCRPVKHSKRPAS